jgi:multidrug efflux pump subunit AcrA (membrane-fusion protein)
MQLSHKVRQAIIGACAALAVVIAGAGMVSAAGQSSGGTTNATVYRFGRDVSVTGTINGDVICGGQNVTIDATVNGRALLLTAKSHKMLAWPGQTFL